MKVETQRTDRRWVRIPEKRPREEKGRNPEQTKTICRVSLDEGAREDVIEFEKFLFVSTDRGQRSSSSFW